MKVVYVAGKFRGPTPWDVHLNVIEASKYGLAVAKLGGSPLIPHANTAYFDKQLTDQFWIEATARLLEVSDGVVFIPRWRESVGARAEHELALKWGKPIFYLDRFETDKLDQHDDYGKLCRWLRT